MTHDIMDIRAQAMVVLAIGVALDEMKAVPVDMIWNSVAGFISLDRFNNVIQALIVADVINVIDDKIVPKAFPRQVRQ
jgi:thiamine pyrophosphate-dependent acetolactate synthase large subunit-like protein